jgi:sRNA-binding protein
MQTGKLARRRPRILRKRLSRRLKRWRRTQRRKKAKTRVKASTVMETRRARTSPHEDETRGCEVSAAEPWLRQWAGARERAVECCGAQLWYGVGQSALGVHIGGSAMHGLGSARLHNA